MARNVVAQIRRATRRTFSADEKIRIVLEGLQGEISVSELCRREGIYPSVYHRWSKGFLEAGKNGLTLDTRRDATKVEVVRLREENESLKRGLVAGGGIHLADAMQCAKAGQPEGLDRHAPNHR